MRFVPVALLAALPSTRSSELTRNRSQSEDWFLQPSGSLKAKFLGPGITSQFPAL